MAEKFILLCGCGWKKISDLNSENGAYEIKNDTMSPRKFRCPSCGFAITPRKTNDPQSELDRAKRDADMEEENKKWLKDSVERQTIFVKEIKDAEEADDK